MSTENKKKVLLGFGAFAVVLIAVLAIWRPPAFRNEDASGSIGAVQKHHAPQITQQDVVLGSETTKHEQQIRYADFLNDAAKLHSLSAKITASNFDAASRGELDAMKAQVAGRWQAEAKAAVEAARDLSRNADNRKMDADVETLAAILQSGQLSDFQMESFNKRLAAFAEQAGIKSAAERAQAARREVDSAVAEMRTNDAAAKAKMESAAQELKAIGAITLADRADFLKVTEMEAKALDRAQAGIMGTPMVGALSAQADALEAKAAKNLDKQLGLIIVVCSTAREIDGRLAEARGTAASEASAASRGQVLNETLENASREFAGIQTELNAQAQAGISAQLSAVNAYIDNRGEARARTPQLSSFLASLSNALNANTALAGSLSQRGQMEMQANQLAGQIAQHKSADNKNAY